MRFIIRKPVAPLAGSLVLMMIAQTACLSNAVLNATESSHSKIELVDSAVGVQQDPRTGVLTLHWQSRTFLDHHGRGAPAEHTPASGPHQRFVRLSGTDFAAGPYLELGAKHGDERLSGEPGRFSHGERLESSRVFLPKQGLSLVFPRKRRRIEIMWLLAAMPEGRDRIVRAILHDTGLHGEPDLFLYFEDDSIGRYTQIADEYQLLKLYKNEAQIQKRLPGFPVPDDSVALRPEAVDFQQPLLFIQATHETRMYRLSRQLEGTKESILHIELSESRGEPIKDARHYYALLPVTCVADIALLPIYLLGFLGSLLR